MYLHNIFFPFSYIAIVESNKQTDRNIFTAKHFFIEEINQISECADKHLK